MTRGSVTGRAVIDRSVFHMEDLATASQEEFPVGRELQRQLGHHTALSVPLMREDRAIGAIALWRMEARRFTDKQIALVKTFADQAAIAIENVRLFDEVQARTRELSESLQQQTATADVLKVISRSAFDLQRVLDTLTESACKLCDAEAANLWRPDGDGFKVAAMFGATAEHRAALKRVVNKPGRAYLRRPHFARGKNGSHRRREGRPGIQRTRCPGRPWKSRHGRRSTAPRRRPDWCSGSDAHGCAAFYRKTDRTRDNLR